MLQNRFYLLLIVAVGLGALVFRLPRLAERPLHTDEAVHTVKAGILLETGTYIYDPHEYHGPTLYYAALPLLRLTGAKKLSDIRNVIPFRLVPVIFGTALVFLLLGIRDGIGNRAAAVAAILTAVSPAMVYYSRYYIMEMLLVFFTFAAMVSVWRYTRSRRLGWALAAGASVGLMHATKETSLIVYAMALGALLLTLAWTEWVDGRRIKIKEYFHHWHTVGALKVAAMVAVFFLTALLSNPAATIDSVRAYGGYFHRAADGVGIEGPSVHRHAWDYYLRLLLFFRYGPGRFWSEGLIVTLALVGIVSALRRRPQPVGYSVPLVRFLAFYTVLLTVVYSVIPYKTPWCLLGFLHGMILMAGIGTASLARRLKTHWTRALGAVILAAGVLHLGLQAYRASYVYPADPRNPYVYAHTSPDLLNLVERVEDLAKISPEGRNMHVEVVVPGSDYWPLPWYLRQFPRVGYREAPPRNLDAPVIITSPALEEEVDERLDGEYFREYFGLRPDVLLTVYIRQSLWDAFIETRK
jgi:uncharacterized protein (TIGR03663 family)